MYLTRRGNHKSIIAVGLVFLALANVARYVVDRGHLLPESLADGVSGLLYGVAIGTTLLGIYLRGRSTRGKASPS